MHAHLRINKFKFKYITFRKECADRKAEHDGREGIRKKENGKDDRWGSTDDATVRTNTDAEKQGFYGDRNEKEEEIFDEPDSPVQPSTQTHQFHGFLKQK